MLDMIAPTNAFFLRLWFLVAVPLILGVQTAFGSPLLSGMNSFNLNGSPGKYPLSTSPFLLLSIAHGYKAGSYLHTRNKFSHVLIDHVMVIKKFFQ